MSIQNTNQGFEIWVTTKSVIDFFIFYWEIIEIILTVLMMYWILTYFGLGLSAISSLSSLQRSQRALITDHFPIAIIRKLKYFIDTLHSPEQQITSDNIFCSFHENLFWVRKSSMLNVNLLWRVLFHYIHGVDPLWQILMNPWAGRGSFEYFNRNFLKWMWM